MFVKNLFPFDFGVCCVWLWGVWGIGGVVVVRVGMFFFFEEGRAAYEMRRGLGGSEM